MNLGLTLSVFRRELLALPRGRRFYWKRTGFIILGGLYVLAGLLMGSGGRRTTMGLEIFMPLAILTLVAMCIMAPTTAASIITREKEERTFGLLFLSDITGWRFVLGKLLTSMFSTLMAIFSVLPLFMLVVSLGGVSASQIAMAFVLLVGTIFLGSSIGVFAACATRTERSTNRLLGLIWMGYCLALPWAVALPYLIKNQTPPEFLGGLISPFWAMVNLIHGQQVLSAFLNAGMNVVLGLPFLWLAQALVPRIVVDKDAPSPTAKLKGALLSFRRIRPWVAPPPITHNPVTWKDLQFLYGGKRATWLKFSVFTLTVVGILLAIFANVGSAMSFSEKRTALLISVFICSAGVAGLGSLNSFGMMFTRERKSKALEILLTTDLTDRDIVWGKVWAAILSVTPWATAAGVSGVILLVLFGGERNFWTVVPVVVVECVITWFAFSCLSLWLSIRYKKNVALGVCILVWVVWNVFGRIVLVMPSLWLGPWAMLVTDVIVHVAFGGFFLKRVFMSFRKLALQDAG